MPPGVQCCSPSSLVPPPGVRWVLTFTEHYDTHDATLPEDQDGRRVDVHRVSGGVGGSEGTPRTRAPTRPPRTLRVARSFGPGPLSSYDPVLWPAPEPARTSGRPSPTVPHPSHGRWGSRWSLLVDLTQTPPPSGRHKTEVRPKSHTCRGHSRRPRETVSQRLSVYRCAPSTAAAHPGRYCPHA